uniref:DUF11 domain-containing protein n=1 Tax=Pseudotamlana agarivorans TaxID=481183 RepID=UPI000830CBCE
MQKNYPSRNSKRGTHAIKLTFLTFLLSLSATFTYAQSCTLNAGLDQTICAQDVMQLNGETPDTYVDTPVWTQISGPSVIISDPTIDDPIITGFTGGNSYTFELSAFCFNGAHPRQTVTITVEPVTEADAGTDIASCPDSSGSLIISGNTPGSGEDGNWSIVGNNSAGVVINQPNSPTSTITLPEGSAGTTTVRWTITGPQYQPGTFCESTSEISITNYGGVEPVDAGPDQTLSNCYTVSENTDLDGSFAGSDPNIQIGTWTFVSGPSTPNIADPNQNDTNVSGLIEGVYVFRWDVSGTCVNGSDTVTITVPPATQDVTQATVANSNQHFCDPSVTETTLTGSNPNFTNETVLWELIQPAPSAAPYIDIKDPNSPTTLVTGLLSTESYEFRYTIINNVTGCETNATVNVRYNASSVSIDVNSGDDIVAACGETSVDVPYTSSGGTKTEYSIISGPADSSISFPTSYENTTGANGTVTINNFDVPGAYKVNFRRSTSGNLTQSCNVANAEITVFISKPASGSSAGSNQAFICGQDNGTLAGSVTQPGETSFWSQVSGPVIANITDPYAQITTVTGMANGIYVFRYTVSGGVGCSPDATSVTTVYVSPADNGISDPGSYPDICVNTPLQLAANEPLIVLEGTWTASDPSIVFSDIHDPNAIATGFSSPDTDYTLTWTIENRFTDCGPPAVGSVVISTNSEESPSAADAGNDICLTSGTTSIASLDANTSNLNEIGTWSQLSGPSTVTFTAPNNPNTEVTGLIDGQYEFQWEIAFRPIAASSCATTTNDTVNVVVADVAAVSSAGPDQSLCLDRSSVSVTMNATDPAPSGGIGTWNLVSGLGGYTVDDINSPTATFSNLFEGTYVFEWVVSYGNCTTAATPDQVQIEIGIEPTPANITSVNQPSCGTTVSIEADPIINPNTETGSWTVIFGPNSPTIDDPSNNIINVSNLITGSYVFRWTILGSSSLCPNSFDEVTVDVFEQLQPIADQNLCEVSSVFLEATTGTTGTWSIVSATETATSTAVTDLSPYTPTQSPSDSNTANAFVDPGYTYVFEYTTNYTGAGSSCNTSQQTTVTVSNGPSEDADAGPDQSICITETLVTLTAGNTSIPSDVTSEWRVLSQPGGANASFSAPDNSLSTDVLGLTVAGIYVFELNFQSNFCTDDADIVRVTVYDVPGPVEAGPDQDLACQQTTQLDATAPTVGIGEWSFADPSHDPSNGAVVIDSPNNPQTTLSNIPDDAGNDGLDDVYILTWTVTSGPLTTGACAPQSDTVTLTYTGTPPSLADAGLDQEYCDVTQFYLNATPLTVGTGTWVQTSGNPTTITAPNNPNSLVLGLTPGNYEFTWTATGGGCSSSDSMEVLIYSDPGITDAGPDQTLPEFSNVVLAAIAPTVGTGVWSQVSGPSSASFIDLNDPNTAVSGTTVGTYVFEWTISNGTCTPVSDQVIINILANSDLELTKTASPSSVNVGDIVTFTLSVFNDNFNTTNSDATGVAVQDVLPLGYSLVSGSVSNGGTYDLASQTISWTNLNIANGATLNLTFDATVNASGSYLNTAQITASDNFDSDSTPNNDDGDQSEDDEDNAQITIQSADLSLDKSISTAVASVGDNVVFTLTVTNSGPDEATNVQVFEHIPSGYTYQSDDGGGNYNATSGIWNVGSIPSGDDETLNITVSVNAPSGNTNAYFNTSEITTSDQADPDSTPNNDDGDQSEDDEDNAEITLDVADLELTKTIAPMSGSVGDTVTFTVLVENQGTGNATGVDVQDVLPSGYNLVPGSISNSGVYLVGNNAIEWDDLSIANGLSVTLTYQAVVNDSGNYTNIAQIIASDLTDPDSTPNNNIASEDDQDDATFVIEEADLELTKNISASSSATPNIGDTVTFELTLVNNGPNDVSSVSVEDIIPAGYTLSAGTIDIGGTLIGNTINWNNLSLTNGANLILSYDVIVNSPTGNANDYTNTAQITSSNLVDPDSTPNNDDGDQSEDDETSFTITPQTADLSINKIVNDNTPNVGDAITFTINLSNAGTVTATNVSVLDVLPVGYSNIANISGGGTDSGNQITWTGLTVPVGNNTVTLTFDATVNAPTGTTNEYLNTVEITASDQFDPDSDSGSSFDTDDYNDGIADDDEDTENISIQQADLSITKTVSNTSPNVGDTVIYTLTVVNAGPNIATGVAVEDVLPSGLTLTTVNNGGTQSGNTATWSGLIIGANNGTRVLSYEATVNMPTGTAGEFTNVAQITASNQFDPDSDPTTDETVDEDGDGDGFDDDEDTVTITPNMADLSLTKTVVNNNITPLIGEQITFEIRLTNDGPQNATGVEVVDLLPSGYSYVSYSSTEGVYNNTTGLWSVGTIVASTTEVLLIDAIVNATGTYLNTAEVTASDVADSDSTPNNHIESEDDQDSVTTTPVVPMADLSLVKTVANGNTSPQVGSQITFQIAVTNDGPQDATGVQVADLLPSGFTYVSSVASSGTYNDVSGIWNTGSVLNGTTETLSIIVTVNTTGDYTNIAEVSASDLLDPDSTPGNDDGDQSEDDEDNITITPVQNMADLSLTKTVANGNTSPLVGSQIVFQIAVTNDGPQNATGVEVTDVLPSGFTFVSAITTSGTSNNTTGVWNTGLVNTGTSETLTILAIVNATGDYLNIAEVTASDIADPDSTPGNGIDTEDDQDSVLITPVEVVADLSLTKTVVNGNTSPIQGTIVSFLITVNNSGPQDATGVEVTDLLPSGYEFDTFSTSSGTYDMTTGIWTLGSIANGDSESLLIDARVKPSGVYLNTAEITASDQVDSDSTPGNNVALEDDQDSILLIPTVALADLSLTKEVVNGISSPLIGSQVTFQITVSNDGPNPAVGVEVTDLLPTGFSYAQFNSTSGTYNPNTGLWHVGVIANGNAQTLLIDATVNAPTGATDEYFNVAEVSASSINDPDSTPGNDDGDQSEDDEDSVRLTPVSAAADLSLTKTVVNGNTTPVVGSQITFEIVVSNDGPNLATGVEVTDILPSGFNYVVFSSTTGTYNPATGLWIVGPIISGNSQTLLIDALVNAPTGTTNEYLNIAQVSASDVADSDSTPGNDDGDQSEDDEDSVLITPTDIIADLSLSKTVVNNNTSPNVGDQITFEITVSNDGPNIATGVEVTDVLPAGFSYNRYSSTSGTYDPTTGLWTTGIIASGGSQTLLIDATVNRPTGAANEFLNIAEVSASNVRDSDSTPGNDDGDQSEDDEDNVLVTPLPEIADLSVTKTVTTGNTSPQVGSQITFQVTLTNGGPSDASGVEVTDLLPSGFNYVSYSSSKGLYDQNTGIWNPGTVTTGATEILLIDVLVNQTGNFENIVEVTASDITDPDSTPGNGIDTEDDYASVTITPVQNMADLSLSKIVSNGNTSPFVGSQVAFQVSVTNAGPQDATGVAVTDLLPSGFTYVSSIISSGTYDETSGIWNTGIVNNGATETLSIVATINPAGDYTNIAEVSASDIADADSTPGNGDPTEDDYDSVTITPVTINADLSLTKTVAGGNTSPLVGSQITFQIAVTNDGPQDATGVAVTDLLPSGFTYVSSIISSGTYDETSGIWNTGTVINGATETLSIVAIVNPAGDYTNIAEVSSSDIADADSTPGNGDPTEDDYDSVTITPVTINADLSLTKTVAGGNTSPLVGTEITFQIAVTNDGPQDATGVAVTDLLPTGFTYVSSIISSGTYDETSGIWNTGTVINGATETLSIVAIINPAGDYTNIAEVSASDIADADSTPGNGDPTEDDYDSVTITPVTINADLSLTKTVAGGNTSPLVGTEITFQIAVTNDGPQDATGVEVTDLLPSGFTYVSSIISSGTYDETSGIWNTGIVNNGATETLSIVVTVNPTGDYTNIAEVSASDIADADSTPNNGDATEDDYDSVTITPVTINADLSLTKTVAGGNTSPLVGSQI